MKLPFSLSFLHNRPPREKLLVFGAAAAIAIWGLSAGFSEMGSSFSSSEEKFTHRATELATLKAELIHYQKLAARAEEIEKLYAKSEISVEQVYTEVEKLVRESIGGDGYELRPIGSVVEVSPTVEQQAFSLRVKSATLQQVVELLHRLDEGNPPLFLGKVEVAKATGPGNFTIAIELSSLRKKRNA